MPYTELGFSSYSDNGIVSNLLSSKNVQDHLHVYQEIQKQAAEENKKRAKSGKIIEKTAEEAIPVRQIKVKVGDLAGKDSSQVTVEVSHTASSQVSTPTISDLKLDAEDKHKHIEPFDQTLLRTFLEEHKIPYNTEWTNFGENLRPQPVLVAEIRSEEELQALIKFNYELNKNRSLGQLISLKVAAGGSGWECHKQSDKEYRDSFSRSETAVADIIVNLVGPKFETIGIVGDPKDRVAAVGPNIQMRYFIEHLEKEGMVPNSNTLMPYATWIGAAMINGINTGNAPSLSDLTLRMKICNFKGEIEWLDPKSEEGFAKIKQCQLGLYGVVLQMYVQCIPAKKLRCIDERRNRYQILDAIDNGLFTNSKVDRVSFMYVPSYKDDENSSKAKPNILLKTWTPVDISTPDHGAPTAFGAWTQKVEVRLSEVIDIQNLEECDSHLVPVFTKAIIDTQVGSDINISVGPWSAQLLFLHEYPHDIADTDLLFRDTIEVKKEEKNSPPEEKVEAKAQTEDGDQQTRKVKVDGKKLGRAMKYIFDKLDEYKAKGLYPVGYAIYARSICCPVKGTEASLAPTHHLDGEIVYSIDIVSNKKIKGYNEFIAEVTANLTGPEFNALPHWGKDIAKDLDIPRMYGQRFKSALKEIKDFYFKRGGDFLRSMFLTESYRNLFKLFAPQLSLVSEVKGADGQERASKDAASSAVLPAMSLLGKRDASSSPSSPRVRQLDLEREKDSQANSSWCLPVCCK